MTFFSMVGYASTSDIVFLRSYQRHKFASIVEGRSYNLSNVVKKANNSFWIISKSSMGLTSKVVIPEGTVFPELPEQAPKAGTKRKLADALSYGAEIKSTASGKVVQVCK